MTTETYIYTTEFSLISADFALIVQYLASSVNPARFADKLYVNNLITRENMENARILGITRSSLIRPLIAAVVTHVEINPANYDKFISILKEYGGLEDLVQVFESQ